MPVPTARSGNTNKRRMTWPRMPEFPGTFSNVMVQTLKAVGVRRSPKISSYRIRYAEIMEEARAAQLAAAEAARNAIAKYGTSVGLGGNADMIMPIYERPVEEIHEILRTHNFAYVRLFSSHVLGERERYIMACIKEETEKEVETFTLA